MHIAVVGGAGYIGSHVVKAMLEAGHQVTVVDNLRSGLRENLFPQAAFVHGDVLDFPDMLEALGRGVEAVVHLAALKAAGESMEQPERYASHNISGTIALLNAMARIGIKTLVFSSSAAVYGDPQYTPIDEEHPTQPLNFYGFTKLEIERLLRWYGELRGIRSVSLRYFNAAGYDPGGAVPGLEQNPANLVPVIMEVAAGLREQLSIFGDDYDTRDGTGIRDYVHVSDLADAHVQALDYASVHSESRVLNLGSERGASVYEMLEAARRITGREIPARVTDRRPGDPAELVASSAQARQLLRWTPQYSDADTLVSTTWAVYERKLGRHSTTSSA
jgi:UDP-glucose 4-epimerase